MKKLLLSGLSVVLLCGCGGTSTPKNTRTCSINQDGLNADVTVTAKDGTNINLIEMKTIIPEDQIAESGYGESIEEAKEQLDSINAFLDMMQMEGLEIDMSIDGSNLVTTMVLDMEKLDQEQLDEIGIDFGDAKTLDDFVKEAEANGGTCK